MKAKRITTLLALLLMTGVTMQAQQWELDFGDQNDINQYSRIDAGVMDADGNAVLIGRFGRRHDWNTQLFKVHPGGSYEHRICEDLPKMLLTHDIVQLDNGNYFTVAQLQPDSTLINYGGSELWAIVFDGNLEIVESKVYTHNSPELKSWPSLLHDNGQVIACGYYYESSNRVFPYMYRFDQNADTLACRYVVPKYYNANDPEFRLQGFLCHKIFKNPSGNGYIFLCNGPGGGIGTAFYDEDFQYVKAYRYILGTPGAADMDSYALGDRGYSDYFLSDDRLLFFGARYPWKQGIDEHLLTIGDLDLSWAVGPGHHGYNVDCGRVNHYEVGFLHEGRRNEEPSGHGSRCMATVNDTTMYGCYMTWYYLGGDLQTGLCLFDRDMEILGGRFFDEDEYYDYFPIFVLPCNDGGCLLAMNGGANCMSSYSASKVMKLTREEMNPIPTAIKELPVAEMQGMAYPNPARDELNIDISELASLEGCRISITDAFGRPCLDRFIRGEGNVLTVGVSGLKAGVYFYRVYNAEKEMIGGKFVKE